MGEQLSSLTIPTNLLTNWATAIAQAKRRLMLLRKLVYGLRGWSRYNEIRISGAGWQEGETYSAIPDSEEQAEYLKSQHKKISHTPDVHHDHMVENIYADALQNIPEDGWDQAVDDMVNRDYEISTPIEDSFEEFQGGQYTEDFVRPDGTTITLMFESGTEYPIANVTGKY